MLKTRIIGVVVVKDNIAVQSIRFKSYLPIGRPEIAIQYLNRWGVDEIVVLHIDATQTKTPPAADKINQYAKQSQVPLSIGGGISTIDDAKKIIRAGADKIILNTNATPNLIKQCGDLFGQQSVVVSMDAKCVKSNQWMTFVNGGNTNTHLTPDVYAKNMQEYGAGELLLTSIDQDGSKQGYDLALIHSVVSSVNIPVIACGGVGHPSHAEEAIKAGACAIAVGNIFHFVEHSVILFKKYLKSMNQPVRYDSYVTYANNSLDNDARVSKQPDDFLNKLRFQYIPEEVI